jgi:hypothetical protein
MTTKQITDLPSATTANDNDLLLKRDDGANADQALSIQTLVSEAFGDAATENAAVTATPDTLAKRDALGRVQSQSGGSGATAVVHNDTSINADADTVARRDALGRLKVDGGGSGQDAVNHNDLASFSSIPSGSRMLFYQASAPSGWSQITSVNDRVIRVVSTSGGGTGGSWTISGLSVLDHVLTVNEMPGHSHTMGSAGSHSHSGSTNTAGQHQHSIDAGGGANGPGFVVDNDDGTFDASYNTNSAGAHSHTLSINSAGSHTHGINNTGGGNAHGHGLSADGDWRPSYADVIVCQKD